MGCGSSSAASHSLSFPGVYIVHAIRNNDTQQVALLKNGLTSDIPIELVHDTEELIDEFQLQNGALMRHLLRVSTSSGESPTTSAHQEHTGKIKKAAVKLRSRLGLRGKDFLFSTPFNVTKDGKQCTLLVFVTPLWPGQSAADGRFIEQAARRLDWVSLAKAERAAGGSLGVAVDEDEKGTVLARACAFAATLSSIPPGIHLGVFHLKLQKCLPHLTQCMQKKYMLPNCAVEATPSEAVLRQLAARVKAVPVERRVAVMGMVAAQQKEGQGGERQEPRTGQPGQTGQAGAELSADFQLLQKEGDSEEYTSFLNHLARAIDGLRSKACSSDSVSPLNIIVNKATKMPLFSLGHQTSLIPILIANVSFENLIDSMEFCRNHKYLYGATGSAIAEASASPGAMPRLNKGAKLLSWVAECMRSHLSPMAPRPRLKPAAAKPKKKAEVDEPVEVPAAPLPMPKSVFRPPATTAPVASESPVFYNVPDKLATVWEPKTYEKNMTAHLAEALEGNGVAKLIDNAINDPQNVFTVENLSLQEGDLLELPDSILDYFQQQREQAAQAAEGQGGKRPELIVLVFARGKWCPWCDMTSHQYMAALPLFAAEGAVVTVTHSDPSDVIWPGLAQYVDPDASLRNAAGLNCAFSKDFAAVHPDFMAGKTIEEYYGREQLGEGERSSMTIPATFVLKPSGEILWRYVNQDFRRRASPAEVLQAVKDLYPAQANRDD